ncbi:N-methyl-L-tryptophan oxidase, partial [Escherichia coli]|nr:N-methyl-L-tryptophan oxidase [Escherichia coli]
YVPLVLRAQTLWDELAALTEERIFERTGVINLGPANSTFLATVEESAKAYRLDVERLDANGIMARWPEISVPDDYIGLFEANSGVLHSETAIKT